MPVHHKMERFPGPGLKAQTSPIELHIRRVYRGVVIRAHENHVVNVVSPTSRQPLHVVSFHEFAESPIEWPFAANLTDALVQFAQLSDVCTVANTHFCQVLT